jgi:hypothetical protein
LSARPRHTSPRSISRRSLTPPCPQFTVQGRQIKILLGKTYIPLVCAPQSPDEEIGLEKSTSSSLRSLERQLKIIRALSLLQLSRSTRRHRRQLRRQDSSTMGNDPTTNPPNASLSGLIATLAPTALVAGVYLLIFLILRRSQRRWYAPRTYLGTLREE